jgi:hypothetical protein
VFHSGVNFLSNLSSPPKVIVVMCHDVNNQYKLLSEETRIDQLVSGLYEYGDYDNGATMKAAVIGAARNHNGIGEFIAKYLHGNDVEVACVLGSSQASAFSAAGNLTRYGIKAKAYASFSQMMSDERVDCVAIASPSHTHKEYIEKCIDEGVHIFCEKPFISADMPHQDAWIEDAFLRAQEKGIVIAMNSQWPFCLPFYEELCGLTDPAGVREFAIRLSPLSSGGEMIPDSVPHGLSLLYCALGSGSMEEITFQGGDDTLTIRFNYLAGQTQCAVMIEMVREVEQPRTFSFGFNGLIARRNIDLGTYTLHLTYKDKILKIADPLGLSVRDFVIAARTGGEPLLGRRHIIHTAKMLRQIYAEYF